MIILGDAGINYWGDKRDHRLKKTLNDLPISLFCIHGNHEMRPGTIDQYELNMERAGKVWWERQFPDIHFAIDGEIYDFAGYKCIAIGGAYSVDKYYRLRNGLRWFADEQPDDKIKEAVADSLFRMRFNVDIVLTHTCPMKYVPTEAFLPGVDQSTVDTSTEEWLDRVEYTIHNSYRRWYCGHYHIDKAIDRVRFMFNDIICLEDLHD